jgi:N-succinyldiaminopimelate aminotransferase
MPASWSRSCATSAPTSTANLDHVTIPGPWLRTAAGAGLVAADGAVGATIFSEMSALAASTGAVDLGQGFPDTDGPPEVLEAARQAISDGVNQYSPGRGMPVLREAIARHQQRFYGLTVDPDAEVLVTAGATEALAATLLALLEPGDEVVTFEPYYDAYAAIAALAGARLVTVPLEWPAFTPDLDRLRAAFSARTRIVLVNDPHNPTGAVLDRPTRELIVELATRHDAFIVTDEVYEHLRFGTPHEPIAALPGAAERTITISSGGKTFSTTGWKIGWLHGRPELVTAILSVKQFLTYVNGAPFQPAIALGLGLPDAFYSRIAVDLGAGRDILVEGLRSAGLTVSVPQGSYFVVADAAPLGATDAAAFCRELARTAGVVGIPVSAFTATPGAYAGLVRFAFCKRPEVLRDAARRLAKLST